MLAAADPITLLDLWEKVALPIATFIIGGLIPIIWRRLSFEGFVVQQPTAAGSLTLNDKVPGAHGVREVTSSTLVKVANSTDHAYMIESARFDPITIESVTYRPVRFQVQVYEPLAWVHHFPPKGTKEHPLTTFPFLVKSHEEADWVVACIFTFPSPTDFNAYEALLKYFVSHPLRVEFRVNGKWRPLLLIIR